jgi:hypothetical protein
LREDVANGLKTTWAIEGMIHVEDEKLRGWHIKERV